MDDSNILVEHSRGVYSFIFMVLVALLSLIFLVIALFSKIGLRFWSFSALIHVYKTSLGLHYWVLFIYRRRVIMISKTLWIVLSEMINILRNLQHQMWTFIADPQFAFKVILRKFEFVFWCVEWECCTFQLYWQKFIQFYQYYTMALS